MFINYNSVRCYQLINLITVFKINRTHDNNSTYNYKYCHHFTAADTNGLGLFLNTNFFVIIATTL